MYIDRYIYPFPICTVYMYIHKGIYLIPLLTFTLYSLPPPLVDLPYASNERKKERKERKKEKKERARILVSVTVYTYLLLT